ncbi:hypothetical protein [Geofilum rhodophaeum]|uniref:hypothetical protein n=1 Tax=Geofilum rhodophaeum TaxID=1965019 RepID=UPI000B52351B|nr:hypothetical protein [Geofilum rhodophaeum]
MNKKKPKFNESLSLQRFRKAIENIETNVQLNEAAYSQIILILNKSTDKELDIRDYLKIDKANFSRLNHPVKQSKAIFNNIKKKNIEFGIIQSYNAFSSYLKNVLSEMLAHKPHLVISKAVVTKNGEAKENFTFTFADIIKAGDYNVIQQNIVDRIFRRLEDEQSTITLLEKIIDGTKVNISNQLKNESLAYLELRHLFIHSSGILDSKYINKYGKILSPTLKPGQRIPQTYYTFQNCIQKTLSICKEIDSQLIKEDIIPERKFKENELV